MYGNWIIIIVHKIHIVQNRKQIVHPFKFSTIFKNATGTNLTLNVYYFHTRKCILNNENIVKE